MALPLAARTRPRYGGVLRVEIGGDPWERPGGLARRMVFEGLTALDGSGHLLPALAVGWEAEAGYRRWEFRLRPDVHFHDGTPLTAAAVVASLENSCPQSCPWSTVHGEGEEVVFAGPAMPNLPSLLAGDGFLIAFTPPGRGAGPAGSTGTGPFQVARFDNGLLELTANGACWRGRPFVDSVQIRTRRAVHDQWLDLGLGHADLVEVPAEQLRAAVHEGLTVRTSAPAELVALRIAENGVLANPTERAAIAEAVDRGALNVIFQKQGEVTASLLPGPVSGYAFLFPVERDLSRARQLRGALAAAPLTLTYEGGGTMELTAERIALNLRDAGFSVQTAPRLGTADLALVQLPLGGGGPAASLEELLRLEGQLTPLADPAPGALYRVEHDFLERHTLVPLLDLPRACAVGPRVRDLAFHADGEADLAQVWLEETP